MVILNTGETTNLTIKEFEWDYWKCSKFEGWSKKGLKQ